jgi:hypothetical protein
MPTHQLRAILNDPFTRGIDGADYAPIRHELEAELWRRMDKELSTLLANYERSERQRIKEQSTAHKRTGVSA